MNHHFVFEYKLYSEYNLKQTYTTMNSIPWKIVLTQNMLNMATILISNFIQANTDVSGCPTAQVFRDFNASLKNKSSELY